MGWLVVLLLGLAAGTQLIPSNDPTSYSATGTPAYTITVSEHTQVSVSEWSCSFWMHPFSNAAYSYLIEAQNYKFLLDWTDTTLTLSLAWPIAVTTASQERMPTKWFFIQFGSTAAMTYAAITLRAGAQYFLKHSSNVPLLSDQFIHLLRRQYAEVRTM